MLPYEGGRYSIAYGGEAILEMKAWLVDTLGVHWTIGVQGFFRIDWVSEVGVWHGNY
jgi:hypothetical protein